MRDDEDHADDDNDGLEVDLAVLRLVPVHGSSAAPSVLYYATEKLKRNQLHYYIDNVNILIPVDECIHDTERDDGHQCSC